MSVVRSGLCVISMSLLLCGSARAEDEGRFKMEAPLLPVRVESNRPIEIYEIKSDEPSQRVLSIAPNQQGAVIEGRLHARGEFQVRGSRVAGGEFRMPEAGTTRISITAGRQPHRGIGTGLWPTGIVLASVGLITLIGGGINAGSAESQAVGPPGWLPLSKQLFIVGGILLPLGVTSLISGLVLHKKYETRVKISPIYEPVPPPQVSHPQASAPEDGVPPLPPPPMVGETPVAATVSGMAQTTHIDQRARGLAEDTPWGVACRGPCGMLTLYRGTDYRVADDGVLGAAQIEVPQDATVAHLQVRRGNAKHRRAGLGLLIAGAMLTGLALVPAAIVQSNSAQMPPAQKLAAEVSLGVFLGLGVPSLAGGIALFINGATRVDVTSNSPPR